MGGPVAALALAAVFVGPARLHSLKCRTLGCTAQTRVKRLCDLYEQVHTVPAPARTKALADALDRLWPSPELRALADEVAAAPLGDGYDLLMDAIEAGGFARLTCPAYAEVFAGPIAVTPRRIIVQGQTLLSLQRGFVPATQLGLRGREIIGLHKALGYSPDGSSVRIGAIEHASLLVLHQLLYSLGRLGVPKVEVSLAGAVVHHMQFDLPAYGSCEGCVHDPNDIATGDTGDSGPQLLGHRASKAGTPMNTDDLQIVVLAQNGDAPLSQPNSASRPALVIAAAATRSLTDVAKTVRAYQGPAQAPRYDKVYMALSPSSIQRPANAPKTVAARVATAPPRSTKSSARRSSQRTAAAADAELRQELQPKMRALKDCYERALKLDSYLSGKVTLHFDIGPSGRTSRVRLVDHSLRSKQVVDCIARRARAWRLPAPADAPVAVSYPLVFSPTAF